MKILIVEDEKNLSRSIVTYLRRENYFCDTADSVSKGLERIEVFDYDCIILDLSCHDANGCRILEKLHGASHVSGLIMISAGNSPEDRIAGLHMGADDYLVKPLNFSELNARIAAIVRRRRFQGQNIIVINELRINLPAKTVSVHQNTVELTRREFDLLLYFIAYRNRVIPKQAIADYISGEAGGIRRNFDLVYAHIKNLKRKLASAGCTEYIKSIYGVGYRFSE